jgi:hypothetical protein
MLFSRHASFTSVRSAATPLFVGQRLHRVGLGARCGQSASQERNCHAGQEGDGDRVRVETDARFGVALLLLNHNANVLSLIKTVG